MTAPAMAGAPGRPRARPARPRRSPWLPLGLLAAVLLTAWSAVGIGFDVGELVANVTRGAQIVARILSPNLAFFPETVRPLIVTIQMAVVASVIGCAVALPAAFLASRVTAPGRWALVVDRGALALVRAIPDLLYAMVFVAALGVGPAAGILALILFDIGVLAKLLSETVDAVDRGPIEAATSAGASGLETVRTAVLPQVLPGYVAYSLYVFELNARAATVIGIVGAGGIGELLNQQMKWFHYQNVGLIVLELFVLVLAIEVLSMALRRRIL